VANIVPVPKKNRKIQICIDYHDLNAAYPKDDFTLSITNIMIDNTYDFERISFMDDFSVYNQIKMYPEDEKHISFRTPVAVYCYTVMPFGLKNTSVTYQNAIFHEHICKAIECYVDDITMKSYDKCNHLADLRRTFDIMRARQLKMNPIMSFLGVASGKVLGFVITSKGIHLDSEKIRAIQEMQSSRNFKELRGL